MNIRIKSILLKISFIKEKKRLPSQAKPPMSPKKSLSTTQNTPPRVKPRMNIAAESPTKSEMSMDTSILHHKTEFKLREHAAEKELDDFEKLENIAQNSSFQIQSTPSRSMTSKKPIMDLDDSWGDLEPVKVDDLLPSDLNLSLDSTRTEILPNRSPAKSQSNVVDMSQFSDDISNLVEMKISQLNQEIEKFQKQTKNLDKARSELNKQNLALQKSKEALKKEYELKYQALRGVLKLIFFNFWI